MKPNNNGADEVDDAPVQIDEELKEAQDNSVE